MRLQKFDYQIKPEKKNRSFVVLSIAVVLLVAGFLVYRSFAAYKVTETYNIIKGSVASFNKDTISLYYYLVDEDGNELSTNEVPSAEDYDYDATRSACESGTEIVYDEEANTVNVTSENEEVCKAYFNYVWPAKKTMIALGNPTVLEGAPDYTKYDETKVGYYKSKDNYGTTYYYYDANVENRKYVEYDGFLYTILRINGDGTLRVMDTDEKGVPSMILSGTDDNAYLGLMYGTVGATTYEETHANTNMNNLMAGFSTGETWFPEEYLGDSIFCNDRGLYNESYGEKEADDTALGFGTNTTYYGSYYRLRNYTPSLMCSKNDAFTRDDEEIGNGKNEYLIGGVTADELMMTGLLYETIDMRAYTISPWYFKDGYASIFGYNGESYGGVTDPSTTYKHYVFNLKAGLEYTGTGTYAEPYQIVTE